jgi:hypothetical protein
VLASQEPGISIFAILRDSAGDRSRDVTGDGNARAYRPEGTCVQFPRRKREFSRGCESQLFGGHIRRGSWNDLGDRKIAFPNQDFLASPDPKKVGAQARL